MAIGDKKAVVMEADRAIANGIATLDENRNVPFDQLGNVTNSNLLRNWFLADPINQRGQTTYGHNPMFTIDGWLINNDYAFVDVNDGYITIRGNDINGYGGIIQHLEDSIKDSLVEKTITFSALMKPYTAMKIAGRQVCEGAENAFGIYSATFTGTTGDDVLINAVKPVTPGEPIADIKAVKLEIGSNQTLAHQDSSGNWVLNEIPNYHDELLKCIQSTADSSDIYANKVITTNDKICNPNLLDNWYFSNPIDQRGGYVVPPGVDIWKSSDPNTKRVTESYIRVEGYYPDGNAKFTIDGEDWCATNQPGDSHIVRGYTASDYTIDRWTGGTSKTVLIDAGHITLKHGSEWLGQFIEASDISLWLNKTYTLSLLLADGSLYQGTVTPTVNAGVYTAFSVNGGEVYLQFGWGTDKFLFCLNNIATNGDISIVAAKLELGDTQTLAHQDDNGNWVLNEIPDYGEQLRRCQRYFWKPDTNSGYGAGGWILRGIATSQTHMDIYNGNVPVTMRAFPATTNWKFRDTTSGEIFSVSSPRYSAITKDGVVNVGNLGRDLTINHVYNVYVELSADL